MKQLAQEARDGGRIIGVRPVALDEDQDDPWSLPPSRRKRIARKASDTVPSSIRLVLSDEIYVPKFDEHLLLGARSEIGPYLLFPALSHMLTLSDGLWLGSRCDALGLISFGVSVPRAYSHLDCGK